MKHLKKAKRTKARNHKIRRVQKPGIVKRIGGLIEMVGEKIEHTRFKKVGNAIEKIGDKVEQSGEAM